MKAWPFLAAFFRSHNKQRRCTLKETQLNKKAQRMRVHVPFIQREQGFPHRMGFRFQHCWHPGQSHPLLQGDCSVHQTVFSNISSFYPFEASTLSQTVTTKTVSRYWQMWGRCKGEVTWVENHWFRESPKYFNKMAKSSVVFLKRIRETLSLENIM